MPSLDRHAARLSAELDRMQWRMSRMRRPAVVTEYDPEKHMARARLSLPNGQGGMTPWARITESAGAQSSRTTLTVGQTVWVDCPNGDIRQCSITAGHHSDNYPAPSTEAEETKLARGGSAVAIRDGEVEITAGGSSIVLSGGGIKLNGARIDIN